MLGTGYRTVEMDERGATANSNRLERSFDREFWTKVKDKFQSEGKSWDRAMNEVRLERLKEDHGADNCLLVILRDWPNSDDYKDETGNLAGLERLISSFTEILLEKDTNEVYRFLRDEDDKTRPTLLHFAATWNYLDVATQLVRKYPGLVYQETEVVNDQRGYLALEKALMANSDETAAFLISQMKPDWVHELFKYNASLMGAKFSFNHYINEPGMKRTVVAVLDSLINPHWPFLPVVTRETREYKDEIERAWSSVPGDPHQYDFFYHLLDFDDQGREPKILGEENREFNRKSKPGLRCIAESDNKEAIEHPVIRMLVTRKWKKFGRFWFYFQAICYVIFLALLSYALIYGATRDDPSKYDGAADNFRGICEVLSIIFVMLYIVEEFSQIIRDRCVYFKDFYNYCDWFGLILTLLVIPLRFADSSSQWSIASLGYLFNFLRIFKFSPVTRTTGLYTKTLAKIIYRDMSRFLVVFVVVCIGFCGALFMAVTATGQQDTFSNYGALMLAAVRVLTEQQQVVEGDYTKFNWLIIILLLAYMGFVIVVLLNVLIAQLSYTYHEAKTNAKMQYSIDRMSIIARLEQWPFGFNFRVKYYAEGVIVPVTDLVRELLEYSEERSSWETMDEKLALARELLKNVLPKKVSEKSE